MRFAVLVLLFIAAGAAAGDDEILKPRPKDLSGDMARPYTGKKVEVTGKVKAYKVDNNSNKWYFPCDLIDDAGKTTAVTIYLFFDDMKAAMELKDKVDAKPTVVVRGVCEIYKELAPRARVAPVVLNATEIVEYVKPPEKKADETSGRIIGELKSRKDTDDKKNTFIEVLAPGEEKPRKYHVLYDPEIKGPIASVLKDVRAAKVGDRVEFEWVQTGHGPAIKSFRVQTKGDGDGKKDPPDKGK